MTPFVESDCSKNQEPDIPARPTDCFFRKLPASAKAEERTYMAILLTGRSVSIADYHDRQQGAKNH